MIRQAATIRCTAHRSSHATCPARQDHYSRNCSVLTPQLPAQFNERATPRHPPRLAGHLIVRLPQRALSRWRLAQSAASTAPTASAASIMGC